MSRTRTYFLSDAHLGSLTAPEPDLRERKLVDFCDHIEKNARALWLLGDLFDFWFEYARAVPARHFRALAALHRLVRGGVEVAHVAGNHDFWKGRYLTEEVGIRVYDEPLTVELDGLTVHLAHGDGITRHASGHSLFRKVTRHPLSRRLYSLLHPNLGIALALRISRLSRRRIEDQLDLDAVAERYRNAAGELLALAPYRALVVGHTHRADIALFNGKTYVNTGNWITDFNYAVLEEGHFSLHTFDPQVL